MSVRVTFPNELLVAVGEDRAQFSQRVMIYTLGQLYQQGKISSGFAAQILDCERWQFYQYLSDYGFAVIDYDVDDETSEAKTSRLIARQVKSQ